MNITELEKLAKAATPGPWEFSKETENVATSDGELDIAFRYTPAEEGDMTGEFISAANPKTILHMLDLIDEMAEALKYYADTFSRDDGKKTRAQIAFDKYKEMMKVKV